MNWIKTNSNLKKIGVKSWYLKCPENQSEFTRIILQETSTIGVYFYAIESKFNIEIQKYINALSLEDAYKLAIDEYNENIDILINSLQTAKIKL